ncbi:MAG: dienelactone hydrolase family protein [Acidimicrobiia bacterium]
MDRDRAGTGYLALPEAGHGPGELVLHTWWGLTSAYTEICDRLAEDGFVALAPDLFAGEVLDDVVAAQTRLAEASADEIAHLTRSSLQTLRTLDRTPDGPVGVMGYSLGASMALWLAARVPAAVAATIAFYGSQDIDFSEATCAFQAHFADDDPFVSQDQRVLLEADLRLLDKQVEAFDYPGTTHWFAEPDRPEFDPAASELAWERAVSFLRDRLAPT